MLLSLASVIVAKDTKQVAAGCEQKKRTAV